MHICVPNEELVLEGYRLRLAKHIFTGRKLEGENEKGNVNELKGGRERKKERESACACVGVYADLSNEPRDISVRTRLYLRGGLSRREREKDSAVHHRRMKNLPFPDEKRYL